MSTSMLSVSKEHDIYHIDHHYSNSINKSKSIIIPDGNNITKSTSSINGRMYDNEHTITTTVRKSVSPIHHHPYHHHHHNNTKTTSAVVCSKDYN